jgi:FkbM family methyltransferase
LCRYLFWRAVGSCFTLRLWLRSGVRILLRPSPSHDLATAWEVFALDLYAPPPSLAPEAVRLVVDLGANVGYSCLYWLRAFPNARVLAFEPHPVHLEQLRKNLELNHWSGRADLVAAAAGTTSGSGRLTDGGAGSSLLMKTGFASLPVPVVDWFEHVGGRTIDLLKMDIEGSEYDLLADPRFAQLDVRVLVLEWHMTAERPDGQAWCLERLHQLGYETRPVCDEGDHGILWANRTRLSSVS